MVTYITSPRQVWASALSPYLKDTWELLFVIFFPYFVFVHLSHDMRLWRMKNEKKIID